jgi:hypothetical protein
MQKILIGILTIATVALAAVCVVQQRQLRAERQEAVAVRKEAEVLAEARKASVARVQELERSEARLEEQVKEFTKVTKELRSAESAQASNVTRMAQQVAAAKAGKPVSNADAEGGLGKGMGEMLGKMMKDPAMREMLRDQQKASVNMMYGSLLKEMKLTPEEKDKLKELLVETQMRNVELAQGMFGDKKDATTADAKKQIEAQSKATEDQIKNLLGDDRFAQYKDYQANIGERMQVDQLGMRLKSANMALDEQQTSQLMKIMKDEKAATPPVISSDPNEASKTMQSLTAEAVDRQVKWMEEYNRRIADKAALVLSPEQFHEYKEFLDQQASMQKLGLQMARQMFGGEKK